MFILSMGSNSSITASSHVNTKISSPSLKLLIEHAPFEIISDDNFTDYGFAGTGSASDPYIIGDFNITTTETTGILIKDTTKHFIIQYCLIETAGYGINFDNIATGTATIFKTTLDENSWAGIYLDYAESVSIINCTLTNNGFEGIDLYNSPGAIISNNTLFNNGLYGIDLWHSHNATLTNNIHTYDGVYIYSSSVVFYRNFTFDNNWVNGKKLGYYTDIDDLIFTDPDYGQLILINCKRPTIHNQVMTNTAIGMLLYWCDNADIMNNTCSNNIYGIYLEAASYSSIVNNTCNSNVDGIESLYDYGSIFANNTCNFNNEYGLWLFISDNCIVYNNTCNDNVWLGFYFWDCSGIIATDNTCEFSYHWGIYLQSSDSCSLSNNKIRYCTDHGIYMNEFSYDNEVYLNDFVDNNLGGVSQGFDDGTNNVWFNTTTLEGNWWSDWSGEPYSIEGTANNDDPYAEGPVIVPELSTGIQLILLLSLFVVAIVPLSQLPKKQFKKE